MTLAERIMLFRKAAVGLFSSQSATQAYSMLAGILPGSHGEPPPRGTREFLQGYSTMPWLRAVSSKIAWMTATPALTLSVATTRTGQPRRMPDVQRADGMTRQKMLKELKQVGELREIPNHPLLDLLNRPNGYLTGFSMRKLWQIHLDLVGENFSDQRTERLAGDYRALAGATALGPRDADADTSLLPHGRAGVASGHPRYRSPVDERSRSGASVQSWQWDGGIAGR